MLLFHGTTLNRLREILDSGFLGLNGSSIWNCSEENTTYFHTESFIREEYDIEGNTRDAIESLIHQGVVCASGNADIALSQERSNLKRIILMFDSKDLDKIGCIEKDNSTLNMEDCAQFRGRIPISLAKKVFIDTNTKDSFMLYFVGLADTLTEMNLRYGVSVNHYANGLDSELLECSKLVYNALTMWFLENLDTLDAYTETTLEELKRIE